MDLRFRKYFQCIIRMDFTCQTEFGKFRINTKDENIKVGGRNFCVNIVLYKEKTSLYWLKTDEGGCELNEKDIHGGSTVGMTDLAFSLLRKNHPERTTITLLDDSGFGWSDKKGRRYKTVFLKGYLLIHGKTWYEDKFNAVMCDLDIYKIYREKADTNFNDPAKKPATFDFMNREINDKLEPLYISSKTWREFIDKFLKLYGKEKYMMMYDWYRSAIYIIFDGMEINQNWVIDISHRPQIDCLPLTEGGGKTRKNRNFFSKFKRLEPFSWSP
jgi:hypothetical protein